MKKLASLLIAFAFTPLVYGSESKPEHHLDTIAFQVSAKHWVTSQTALLSVNIHVTLNDADLSKARAEIMERLNKIASGEWHLIEFRRSQDSSGLEKLLVKAQQRVTQDKLTTVYQKAKAVSQPGANYSITGIEFKPSLEETQQVSALVRKQLYQTVSQEIERINAQYKNQKYSLSKMVFVEGADDQPKPFQGREMNTMALAAQAPDLTVSNELVMRALVEVASNRPSGD